VIFLAFYEILTAFYLLLKMAKWLPVSRSHFAYIYDYGLV